MPNPATQMIAAFPSDLKLSNRMQILEIFKTGEEYTVSYIANQIGVSRQTVTKAIQFFIQKGLIVSVGKDDSSHSGGKRPELYTLSADRYLLCVSLWPDVLRLTLLNFQNKIIDSFELKQSLPARPEIAMQNIGKIANQLLRHNKITSEQLCGVSVSTSGIVDYHTNSLKYTSLSPDWGRNIKIADLLHPYFAEKTPILVENVAKVVGRSILHEQELRNKRVLVVFSSWGGICACFIERERILNGVHSLIGEIGHMVLDPNSDVQCGCGGRGCFERLVSNEELRKYVAETASSFPDSILNSFSIDELNVSTVFSASSLGDSYAQGISARLAKYFAMALRNVTLSFDPEIVVFQGEFAAADEHFRQVFRQNLSSFQYYPDKEPFTIHFDQRPIQELNIHGGYTMLLDHLFSDSALYE